MVLNAGIVRLVWLEAILETELDLEWIVGVVTCSGNASEGAWIGEGKTTGLQEVWHVDQVDSFRAEFALALSVHAEATEGRAIETAEGWSNDLDG